MKISNFARKSLFFIATLPLFYTGSAYSESYLLARGDWGGGRFDERGGSNFENRGSFNNRNFENREGGNKTFNSQHSYNSNREMEGRQMEEQRMGYGRGYGGYGSGYNISAPQENVYVDPDQGDDSDGLYNYYLQQNLPE